MDMWLPARKVVRPADAFLGSKRCNWRTGENGGAYSEKAGLVEKGRKQSNWLSVQFRQRVATAT